MLRVNVAASSTGVGLDAPMAENSVGQKVYGRQTVTGREKREAGGNKREETSRQDARDKSEEKRRKRQEGRYKKEEGRTQSEMVKAKQL